jgi:hypothetical protein
MMNLDKIETEYEFCSKCNTYHTFKVFELEIDNNRHTLCYVLPPACVVFAQNWNKSGMIVTMILNKLQNQR